MIELQYESKFDGFLVDLRIGPAEELNNTMFGGEEVFTYKRGATVSSNLLPAETFGCLVWIERLDGSPESIATFFHELVHASTLRFEKSDSTAEVSVLVQWPVEGDKPLIDSLRHLEAVPGQG